MFPYALASRIPRLCSKLPKHHPRGTPSFTLVLLENAFAKNKRALRGHSEFSETSTSNRPEHNVGQWCAKSAISAVRGTRDICRPLHSTRAPENELQRAGSAANP